MYQSWWQTVLEMQQPVTGVFHVGPAVGHPLEFVVAFEEVEIGDTAGVVGLSGAQRWSHRSEQDFDAVRLEGARQFKGISPHAADGVGSHENARQCLSHSTHIAKERFILGRGQYHPR